jgi:hypothetical protein
LLVLAGPLRDVKKLESVDLDTVLGPLRCEGLIGRGHIIEDDGHEEDLTYDVRRHAAAPFGVVSCRIECEVKREGKSVGSVSYDFKLTGAGKDATSELREYQ